MTRLLAACSLLLVACGARTELDPFSSDSSVVGDAGLDAQRPDVAPPGPGVTIGLFSGNTRSDGTTWSRPSTCGSSPGRDGYFYSVVTFENPTREALRVEILVDWDFDGFLHVYESPFDPSRLSLRCLAANDDFGGTDQSQVDSILVPAGGAIDLVLSSFSPGSTGSYNAFVITR